MSMDVTQEANELMGGDKNESQQIAQRRQSARQTFGSTGVSEMVRQRIHAESSRAGVREGMADGRNTPQEFVETRKTVVTREPGGGYEY